LTSVKIVSTTQPLISGVSSVGEFIAYCARVSNPGNQLNNETAPKLLKYLAKNKHWSPFEMAHVTMEIVTTRDIAHQIVRHRSFAFQEFSQRYAAVDVSKFVKSQARLQDNKNRQNSIVTDDEDIINDWLDAQDELLQEVSELYVSFLERGLAKEVARKILPEGLTATTLYMSGSIRSWLHYIDLRAGNGTQLEHQEVALKCKEQLLLLMPELSEFLSA
jgi:thymidylate synthase (FAD)